MSDVFLAVTAASFVLLLCSGLLAIAFMRALNRQVERVFEPFAEKTSIGTPRAGARSIKLKGPAIVAKDVNQLRYNDPGGADCYGDFKQLDHWLRPPTVRPEAGYLIPHFQKLTGLERD